MFIALSDVPRYERHLLFCTDPSIVQSRRAPSNLLSHTDAVNRSLAIHGESVDDAALIDAAPLFVPSFGMA